MRIASTLSCFILLIFTACRSDNQSTQENQEEAPPALSADAGPQITPIGFSRKDTVLHYTLDVKYPAIREHEVFNAAVRTNLETAIEEFTDFIRDFNDTGRVMRSEYQLVQHTSRVASVRQMYEWAVPGVSTLLYRFYNVNYNPEAKKMIRLEDIFRDGEAFRPWLKERLAEKIQSRFKVEVEVANEDLETFVIGPDYLEFYKVLYPDVMDPEPKAFQVKFSEMTGRLR